MRNWCALLAAAFLATACTEKLGSGRACPDLCPIEDVAIADTTISGVVVDSTVYAGPELGSESRLLLATRADGQVDLRAVVRFDTLPVTTLYDSSGKAASDTIRAIKGASLMLVGDSIAPELLPSADFTLGVYDVDTTGVADTAVAPVAALFTASRRLGQATFRAEQAADTLLIPIGDSLLLARMRSNSPLRLGVKLESGGNTTIRLSSYSGANAPRLRYFASHTADTTAAPDTARVWFPYSRTPTDDAVTASNLRDYTLVVKGTPAPPTGAFGIGGIPSRRTYLAFDIPKRLLDSTQIVRATLRLTQIPSPTASPRDTARLEVLLGTARAAVTDVGKRTLLHENVVFSRDTFLVGTIAGLRELRLKVDTTATRSIEIAPILRNWAGVDTTVVPHTVILELPTEGTELTEIWFSSLEGPAAQRPRLQLTYVPRNAPGIP